MITKLKQYLEKLCELVLMTRSVSDTLKLPIFDKKVISRLFGIQIAGIATALSVVTYPSHAFNYNLTQTIPSVSESQIELTTKPLYSFPLEATLGMSQDFHLLHPGVDLRAPRGTAVYSMDDGIVVEIEKVTVGYGHFVRIAHAGTISSLYAHLNELKVKPGDKVTKGQIIGDVGMTGWTTGPHLHFEVYVGDKSVNPIAYIGQAPFHP